MTLRNITLTRDGSSGANAIKVGPSKCAAYIVASCAGNSALRVQVEALLAEHDRANGFFGTADGARANPGTSLGLSGRTVT